MTPTGCEASPQFTLVDTGRGWVSLLRCAWYEHSGETIAYTCFFFSFLLMLNSQGSGLDVPDADLETDEDLVSASNTRGHCDVQRLADDGRRLP